MATSTAVSGLIQTCWFSSPTLEKINISPPNSPKQVLISNFFWNPPAPFQVITTLFFRGLLGEPWCPPLVSYSCVAILVVVVRMKLDAGSSIATFGICSGSWFRCHSSRDGTSLVRSSYSCFPSWLTYHPRHGPWCLFVHVIYLRTALPYVWHVWAVQECISTAVFPLQPKWHFRESALRLCLVSFQWNPGMPQEIPIFITTHRFG